MILSLWCGVSILFIVLFLNGDLEISRYFNFKYDLEIFISRILKMKIDLEIFRILETKNDLEIFLSWEYQFQKKIFFFSRNIAPQIIYTGMSVY